MKSISGCAKSHALAVTMCLAVAALAGCGGGGGGGGSSTPAPPPPPSAFLSGKAATGSALAHASVLITNGAGNSPCQESSITTTAQGTYLCTLNPSETAPFFFVVTDPNGSTPPLVSAATTTPGSGVTMTVNATPLTTAIVAQLSANGNALSVVNARAIDAAAFQQVTSNLLAQLANVLASVNAPAGYNPFSSLLTAATASAPGNAADQLLDIVKVINDPASGKLALTTIDDPTPVLMASATTAGTPLPTPNAGVNTLPLAAQGIAQDFSACFALPVAQRVLASDTQIPLSQGGPSATSLAPACQGLTATAASPAGIDFLHNGYASGQWLYSLLTDNTMTGATFSVPEIMVFYAASAATAPVDQAVVNIKYLDANGNPGNLIAVARSIPNSSSVTHPTTWWLTGNQQSVEVNVRPLIRRHEQLNAASASVSRFQTGLQFLVNAKGPGSVTAAGALTYARIKGPGLPANGLVYAAPVAAEVGQVSMDLINKTGVISGTQVCYNCPNYWFARTVGLSGNGAVTLGPNFTGLTWAPDGVDTTQVSKGQRYAVELFYGASTVAAATINKTLLTNLVPATQGVNLPWNTPGSQTLGLLNPLNTSLNGVLSSLTVDWVQNIAAEQIRSVNVTVDLNGSYSAAMPVPRGSTSIVVTPTPAMPALTTTSNRAVLLHYRTFDNTDKNSVFTYN